MNLQSLKNEFEPRTRRTEELRIISSGCVPVEVFIIFLLNNQREYTSHDIVKLFWSMHSIHLTASRVRIILNELVSAGKLKRAHRLNKKQQFTYYYSFKQIS